MEKGVLQVIDNFLPPEEFGQLQKAVVNSHFPWFLIDWVGYPGDSSDLYFQHVLFRNHVPTSQYYDMLEPILKIIRPKALICARLNMYAGRTEFIEHGRHTDFDYPHKGILLSINTNNGYTHFENGDKVHSVANRALIFNPHVRHNSTNTTDQKWRINLLINYFD